MWLSIVISCKYKQTEPLCPLVNHEVYRTHQTINLDLHIGWSNIAIFITSIISTFLKIHNVQCPPACIMLIPVIALCKYIFQDRMWLHNERIHRAVREITIFYQTCPFIWTAGHIDRLNPVAILEVVKTSYRSAFVYQSSGMVITGWWVIPGRCVFRTPAAAATDHTDY